MLPCASVSHGQQTSPEFDVNVAPAFRETCLDGFENAGKGAEISWRDECIQVRMADAARKVPIITPTMPQRRALPIHCCTQQMAERQCDQQHGVAHLCMFTMQERHEKEKEKLRKRIDNLKVRHRDAVVVVSVVAVFVPTLLPPPCFFFLLEMLMTQYIVF
jgi:hypothetical protein